MTWQATTTFDPKHAQAKPYDVTRRATAVFDSMHVENVHIQALASAQLSPETNA
ncbi:MAG: hypothetical protein NXI01_01950 [Gammaproteobacteria bacterium]|nr:hypothetical protein [Gammaproteobacteria bacterium]